MPPSDGMVSTLRAVYQWLAAHFLPVIPAVISQEAVSLSHQQHVFLHHLTFIGARVEVESAAVGGVGTVGLTLVIIYIQGGVVQPGVTEVKSLVRHKVRAKNGAAAACNIYFLSSMALTRDIT